MLLNTAVAVISTNKTKQWIFRQDFEQLHDIPYRPAGALFVLILHNLVFQQPTSFKAIL